MIFTTLAPCLSPKPFQVPNKPCPIPASQKPAYVVLLFRQDIAHTGGNGLQSDIPIKRLLQIRTEDWVKFIFPGQPQVKLEDMQSDMVARIKKESLMDNVKWLNGDTIVHFEPMGYKDDGLPCRMLRYRADIWEYTVSHGRGCPSIKQAVIFFYEKHDNGNHHLRDDMFDYSYKVIKVWEIKDTDIIDKHLVGLYPLLPLTSHTASMSGGEAIKSAIDAINTVSDPVCKADLLAAMSMLAEEKYSKSLVQMYVRREMLMQSALFQEWVSDFVDEAVEKAVGETEQKTEQKIREEIAATLLHDGQTPDYVAKIVKFPVDKIKALADDTMK